MTDLERVLQGLDCVSGFGHCLQSEAFAGGICAYCIKEIAKKAKELLKEQETAYQGAEELLRQKTILFDDAINRLKEQEAVMEWKDARHELPDKEGYYLVFIPGEFHDTMMVARYSFNYEIPWRGAQAHSAIEDVLLWMPLPKVQKESW